MDLQRINELLPTPTLESELLQWSKDLSIKYDISQSDIISDLRYYILIGYTLQDAKMWVDSKRFITQIANSFTKGE